MITSGTRQRSRDPGDRRDAIAQRSCVAVEDGCTQDAAARELYRRVHDESMCWQAPADLSKIIAGSSGSFTERAAAIVERDLRKGEPTEVAHVASCGWLHDVPCRRRHPDL